MATAGNGKGVLISGAGLASLLLGQALRRASIPFTIFERDASVSFRAQGYRLRLSSEGIDAVEAVLEPAHFARFWETCGKTGGSGFAALAAVSGEQIENATDISDSSEDKKRPPKESLTSRDGKIVGISRGEMRAVFLEGLESHIRWAHQVTGYETTAAGVRAVFADGSKSDEGELLVGGEGIYSKVARQVSGGKIKTYDTGARGIHGQAPTTAFKALGEGVWRIVDDTQPVGKVFAITNVRPGDMDDPSISFGWTIAAEPGVIRPPNDDLSIIGKPAADLVHSLTANWHPRIKPLFDEIIEADAAFWKITCSTPSGVPEWENHPRVTVIGDAVHSMTPAGGIGANTAVRDSALLGKLIADAGGFRDGLTKEYETKMRVYASEAVRTSYGNATESFGVLIDENSPTV